MGFGTIRALALPPHAESKHDDRFFLFQCGLWLFSSPMFYQPFPFLEFQLHWYLLTVLVFRYNRGRSYRTCCRASHLLRKCAGGPVVTGGETIWPTRRHRVVQQERFVAVLFKFGKEHAPDRNVSVRRGGKKAIREQQYRASVLQCVQTSQGVEETKRKTYYVKQ